LYLIEVVINTTVEYKLLPTQLVKQGWNFKEQDMKAVAKRIISPKVTVDTSELQLTEKLVSLSRVVKVVKGGKNLHFRALVVSGDGNGYVGIGVGKAREVPDAIRKAGVDAKKNLIQINIREATIPHEIVSKFGAARVLLKPAPPGTGVIAGGGVRAVIEAVGIKDVLSKSLGSANPINVVKATLIALSNLRIPEDAIATRKSSKSTKEATTVG
jgi:small subunit ribosomal protein S5